MNVLFWSVVALDALLFLFILISTATSPGATSNGGREMGMFFFGIVPLVALALAATLFYFSRSLVWKSVALLVVLGPGLYYANLKIRDTLIDYRIRQNHLGRGYFHGADLKSMGAAVVRGDLDELRRVAPSVDLQATGDRGMTLIRLAAEQVPINEVATERVRVTVAVVEELLRLGAAPDPALSTALKADDPALLQALLAHGAHPNAVNDGEPVVFEWLKVMPATHLILLIDKGLDINVTKYHESLALASALNRRLDLVLVLGRNGADLSKPRKDGRTVATEIASIGTKAREEGVQPPVELAAIEEMLTSQSSVR